MECQQGFERCSLRTKFAPYLALPHVSCGGAHGSGLMNFSGAGLSMPISLSTKVVQIFWLGFHNKYCRRCWWIDALLMDIWHQQSEFQDLFQRIYDATILALMARPILASPLLNFAIENDSIAAKGSYRMDQDYIGDGWLPTWRARTIQHGRFGRKVPASQWLSCDTSTSPEPPP